MDILILLARIIGPLLVVVGVGVLVNPAHYAKMAASFLANAELYYFSGVLAFILGMVLVLYHNLWVADWRVVITIIGWASLVKGIFRIVLPGVGSKFAENFIRSTRALNASVIFVLIVGAWLSYQGFVA